MNNDSDCSTKSPGSNSEEENDDLDTGGKSNEGCSTTMNGTQTSNQHTDPGSMVHTHDSQPQRLNFIVEEAIQNVKVLTDSEKYLILTMLHHEKIPLDQESSLDIRYFPYKKRGQQRKISFQKRWLKQHTWLFYGGTEGNKGGWCLPCIFFLTESEKAKLKSFVNTPFVNYNKSKEILAKHSNNVYHMRAVETSYAFKSSYSNPVTRIDNRLMDINQKNFLFNCKVLPVLIEAVLICARQKIALQGHRQDKIDFMKPPSSNEGNFIAFLRLLAQSNSALQEHLMSGPKNARYVSKTIQNEILEIAATQVRQFYQECLKICPHFSVIGDEVTSHGKEILSVCLRFLEIKYNSTTVAKKHEVLLDFHFLERITGQKIAEGIVQVLQHHKINITNCRGQA